ncbi:hypothetical protein LWI29_000257 [Acer saccharum]|uniref:Pentatricopeptide repeat-containing protein n=1 Tax=Acer saccharum TaxID=4024 RepID=A0AA39RT89_ACESA|nr:hypothetical protein LWI29_000257 [Acer saccharum]
MLFNKIKRTPFALFQFTRFCTSCETYVSGFGPCNYNKILSNYFKSGFIREAEDLFDEIPERDVVSWSTLIHGYAINGYHRKSVESFSQMRFAGLFFNSFTMVGVLVGTAGLRNLKLAKSIHGLILKCGLESNLRVSTAMFNVYARCGNVSDSYALFLGLKKPNYVSCNAIVAGFIRNEHFEEAIFLFDQFRMSGLVPNVVSILTVVRGCVALGARTLCESIHGLVVKLGLILDISVDNSLLDMYSSLMDLDTANKIFKEMECKDIISWTIMMGLLIDLQYACEALNIFCKMRKSGIICDSVVVINLISACAILGDLKRGRQIHAQAVVCGFESELHLANSIIAMYSKCGDLDASRAVFNQTTAKSLVSWTVMISGCVQNGCAKEALNLLIKARKEKKYSMDSMMLVSALITCAELAAFEICQQLHCYSFQVGFLQYRPVQNSLISTYSKCGNVDLAYVVFKEMGFLQDVVSWNAIISGHGINGQGETALTLYRKMRKCGENPDSATYSCILSACSHAGLIDDGLVIFKQLVEENKVSPSREHYGCIIDLLARAGRLSDASWIAGKISKGMGTDFWRALLNGCVLHGNVKLAELVATKVIELEPEESDQAVLLSNVYASVGRFQDAAALRSSMQKKGLIKNPGISFLNSSSSVKGSEYPQKSSQVSWWSNHYKDLFASASGISRYPYKLLIKCKLDCWKTFGRDGYRFWRALHSGCVLHGNVELAELVTTKVFGLEPEEFYQAVLLSNVYASVGRFQDAEAVRSKNLFVLTGIVEYETYHLALVITEYSSFLDGILLNLAVSFLFREENAEQTAWIWSRNDIWWLQNHQLSHQTS